MTSDPYYKSKEFLTLLQHFEAEEAEGRFAFLDSDEYIDLAQYYFDVNQHQKAKDITVKALEFYPDNSELQIFRARIALIIDNDRKAACQWMDLVEEKELPSFLEMEVELALDAGKVSLANTIVEKTIEGVDDEDTLYDLITAAVFVFFDYQYYDETKKWLDRLPYDDEADIQELKAKTLANLNHFPESDKILNKLIDSDPYSTRYWNTLCSTQLMRNKLDEATESCDYALAINPDDEEALLNRAYCVFQLGNYEEALRCYEQYTNIVPYDENGFLFKGICLYSLNREAEAIQSLNQAIAVAPPSSEDIWKAYQELAFIMNNNGQTEKALAYVEEIKKLRCEEYHYYVIKGHILLGAQRIDEAVETFDMAIKKSNEKNDVYYQIGVSAYENGYPDYAIMVLGQFILKSGQENPDGYAYIAACYWQKQDYKAYMKFLRTSVVVNPQEAYTVLAGFYPEGLEPKEYVAYSEKHPF